MYKNSKKSSEESIKLGKKITSVTISFYIFGLIISFSTFHGIYAWGWFILVDESSGVPEDSFLLYLGVFIFGLWILSIPLKKITIFRLNERYDFYLGKSLIDYGGKKLLDVKLHKEFEKQSLKARNINQGTMHTASFVVLRTNNGYINFVDIGFLGFQISNRSKEKLACFLMTGPDFKFDANDIPINQAA